MSIQHTSYFIFYLLLFEQTVKSNVNWHNYLSYNFFFCFYILLSIQNKLIVRADKKVSGAQHRTTLEENPVQAAKALRFSNRTINMQPQLKYNDLDQIIVMWLCENWGINLSICGKNCHLIQHPFLRLFA